MRQFTDGAEMADTLFWSYAAAIGTGTSAPALSPYYYDSWSSAYKSFPTPVNEFYFRGRVKVSRLRSDEHFIQFRSGGNTIAWAASSGTYWNTSSGITSITITAGIWYLVEIYFKLADAGGRFTLKVDGTIGIDYTGDTNPGAYTTIDNFYTEMYDGQHVYWDDLALNDTSNTDGKNDNSWCGDGIIVKLIPSGSSATANNWVNSGSVSGSANYLYVDEYPNDGDTTYVYASASSTTLQTQFTLSDFPLQSPTITRIWSEGRARKTSAKDYGVKIGTIAVGGTDDLSGSMVLQIGSYGVIRGNEVKVNPVTSASWTKADVDGLELILEIP